MDVLRFTCGVLVGSLWSAVNFALLFNILKPLVFGQSRKKLPVIFLVKFPALYLIGFLVLISKYFPIAGLLIGFGLTLPIVGVFKIWRKNT